MSDILELYLIRHGKTICNEKKLYCGKTDVPLSENGIIEVKKLKDIIDYPKCEKYFTSGAKRANQTFNLLYEDKDYEEINDFFEYDFGDFEMKSYEDLKKDIAYIDWITDDIGDISCPNGESKNQYKFRIKNQFINFIDSLKFNKFNSALLVSHGGTIGTILELFYDDSKNFYTYQPSYAIGYKLIIELSEDRFNIKEFEELKEKIKKDK